MYIDIDIIQLAGRSISRFCAELERPDVLYDLARGLHY